jgi:hypothetical protein
MNGVVDAEPSPFEFWRLSNDLRFGMRRPLRLELRLRVSIALASTDGLLFVLLAASSVLSVRQFESLSSANPLDFEFGICKLSCLDLPFLCVPEP